MPIDDRIRSNVQKMVSAGVDESDIHSYLASEGINQSSSLQPQAAPNPSEGGSSLKIGNLDTGIPLNQGTTRFLSGAGKAFSDAGRGYKQIVTGLEEKVVPQPILSGIRAARAAIGFDPRGSQALASEQQNYKQLDQPLMQTGGGKVGNIGTNVAMTLPTLAIPGINTYTGAALLGGGLGALQPTESAELGNSERLKNIGTGTAFSVAGKYVGNKLANALMNRAASKSAEVATKQAQNAPKQAALEAAQEAGYVVPPAQVNPTLINRATNWLGGKAATEKLASMKHGDVTDSLLRKAAGLSEDTPLVPEALKPLKEAAGKGYEALRQAGSMKTDPEFTSALADITKKYQGASKDFPELAKGGVADEIAKAVESVKKNNFSADAAVDAVKILRDNADTAFRQGNRTLAKAYGQISKSLEDVMERNLEKNGMEGLLQNFRASREQFAKIFSVEKALNSRSGAAQELAAQLAKGKPLTGELKTVAEFAKYFPNLVQKPEKLGALAGTGYADTLASALLAAGTGHPAYMAGVVARPAIRALMLSKGGQSLLANAPKYSEPYATKLAAELLKNPQLRGMLPAGAASSGLIYSTQQ